MDILNYAYKNTNISYIGVNFHIRYCKDCGTYIDSSSKNVQIAAVKISKEYQG